MRPVVSRDVQRDLVRKLAPPPDPTYVQRRQAVVMAYDETFKTTTIALGNNTASPMTGVRHLGWYIPIVGDTVWVDFKENDALIIGTVALPALNVLPLGSGWVTVSGITPTYELVGRTVVVNGLAGRASGAGTFIGSVPTALAPSAPKLFAQSVGNGFGQIGVSTAGLISTGFLSVSTFVDTASGGYVSLDGISWVLN